jgi:hypothetical protein
MKKQFLKTAFSTLIFSALWGGGVNAQVGIGTTSPNASAVLDLTSTSQGFLPPRMTQDQRNAIVSPAAGLMVWCTNCGAAGEFQGYNGTSWNNIGAAVVFVPSAPLSPVATAGNAQASVVFNVPLSNGGATIAGYTVTSSPGGFTATGASSPIVVTGLSNGTAYTFTVVATNAAGNSSASSPSLQVTPFGCGTSTVTFTYNGASVTYGTVTGANSKCWLDRNLGATRVAQSSTDHLAYGDLFQWGRGADGHQRITWTNATTGTAVNSTTATLSTTDTPGNNLFITNSTSPFDWRSSQNDNLWQGVSGTNNPCPSGYRLPTDPELDAERASWSSQNAAGAFASPLKLPVSGSRNDSNGSLYDVGTYGFYWGSTVSGANSRSRYFGSSDAFMGTSSRAFGFSVRCLKD